MVVWVSLSFQTFSFSPPGGARGKRKSASYKERGRLPAQQCSAFGSDVSLPFCPPLVAKKRTSGNSDYSFSTLCSVVFCVWYFYQVCFTSMYNLQFKPLKRQKVCIQKLILWLKQCISVWFHSLPTPLCMGVLPQKPFNTVELISTFLVNFRSLIW